MSTHNRIAWIDHAKGIGILLVVLGHNPLLGLPELNWVHHLVFLFHMPLFFLLSGLVHKGGKLGPHIQSRVRSVLVPYAVTGLLFALLNHWLVGKSLTTAAHALLLGIGPRLPQPHFWFLNVLFVAGIAAILLGRLTSRFSSLRVACIGIRIAMVAFIAWVGVLLPDHNAAGYRFNGPQFVFYVWPWNLDLLPVTLAFYLIGCWYQEERGKTLPAILRSPLPAICIVLITSAVLFHVMHGNLASTDLFMRIAFGAWVLPAALAGIALVLVLSAQVRGWPARALQYLGQRSLVIFLFHYAIQNMVVNQRGASYIGGACGFVAAIAASPAIDALIRRSRVLSWIYYPSLPRAETMKEAKSNALATPSSST